MEKMIIKKIEKPEWITYTERAKKTKEKILNRLCKNCDVSFNENGISIYESICKVCVNGKN